MWSAVVAGVALLAAGLASLPAPAVAVAAPRVLLVGSWQGTAGPYSSIQAAVDAAHSGDWVLVGPGDYRSPSSAAGVLVTTAGLHIRGMDRNSLIVDGTKPTGAAPCSANAAAQDFGPGLGGRNGVEVLKASGVSVENLTVCNFLDDSSGHNGNQLWFNGGDGSGRVGLGSYRASYVTATSTFFAGASHPMALYGVFASNSNGPGLIEHTVANNMGDSAYYVGACPDCHAVIDDAHGSHSALGYSGTNSGGHLIIQRSEFNDNVAGIVPNSLNNDDAPPPQNGACPGGEVSPTGSHSCTIIRDNLIHDNNDPNVPRAGVAALAPVGTGIEIAGGRNDTVVGNTISHNGSWGVLVHDFPDTETPPAGSRCQGGVNVAGAVCYFAATGNEVANNAFAGNGFFANPSNGDLGLVDVPLGPGDCFHGNTDAAGVVTSDPPLIQLVDGVCGLVSVPGPLAAIESICASGLLSSLLPGIGCPTTSITKYPVVTGVTLAPVPGAAGLADPCAGVPANPWCRATVAHPTAATRSRP
jgi:hypothetical protein